MANNFFSKLALATVTVGLGLTVMEVNSAQAVSFGFDNIDSNNQYGDAFVNDFGFDVVDGGNGTVIFNFTNADNDNNGHAIGDLYWDDSTDLLSNMNLNVGNVGIVSFSDVRNPNLAQGNNISFDSDFGIKFNGRGGGINNGVQGNEVLGVAFNGNFDSVVAALNNGDLRVGIHVQSISKEYSDSFVSKLPTVANIPSGNTAGTPEPLTILGSVAALGFGALFKKKHGKK